jgi:hypothetical protein
VTFATFRANPARASAGSSTNRQARHRTAPSRRSSACALGAAAIAAFGAACGGHRSDAALAAELRAGISQIEATASTESLARKLRATLGELRRVHADTPRGRRARSLAIAGFTATLRGVETQLSMRTHDSGKLEAAVRDAKRADRYLNRGARLLRAAGRLLGVHPRRIGGR